MNFLFGMEIANVLYNAHGHSSIALLQPGEAYGPFLADREADHAPDISIIVDMGHMPGGGGQAPVFDTGQSWSMVKDHEGYRLIFAPPGVAKPLWQAAVNHDFSHARMCCDPTLSTQSQKQTLIPNPLVYPFDQIMLIHYLALRQGVLIHSACLSANGRGFLFPGRSGAGKSTLARQLSAISGVSVLSDDRAVVRDTGKGLITFGTPWSGEAGNAINKGVGLEGIFFITRKGEPRVKKINTREAFEKLLPVASITWFDKENMTRILQFCEEICTRIPCYELCFTPEEALPDAFEKLITA